MYIVLEGTDGSGKDTQADMLHMWLSETADKEPLRINEPDADSPTGKLLRACLKSGDYPQAHAAMFLADRMALQPTKIIPALQAGRDVIQCRSFVSTLVYQQEQWGSGEGLDWLFNIHRMLPAKPDAIIILDVDPAVGLERVSSRGIAKEVYDRPDIQTRNRQRYLDLVADPRLLDFLAPGGKVIAVSTTGLDPVDIHTTIVQALGGMISDKSVPGQAPPGSVS